MRANGVLLRYAVFMREHFAIVIISTLLLAMQSAWSHRHRAGFSSSTV
jgi:hypothetical protein